MNILCVMAHPDDEVLGCGGTIARFVREEHNVRVMAFTDGGGARGPGNERWHQLREASFILGFTVMDHYGVGFVNNAMDGVPLLDVIKSMETSLRKSAFVPDIVLTHSPWCLNVDHKCVFQAAEVVFRTSPARVMCFEVPSSSEWAVTSKFQANCHVKLGQADIDMKVRTLREAYGSELRSSPHPRSVEAVVCSAVLAGAEVCVPFAERFMIARDVML